MTVDVVDGEDSYTGSTANGITSQDYPAYTLSFVFPADQPSRLTRPRCERRNGPGDSVDPSTGRRCGPTTTGG